MREWMKEPSRLDGAARSLAPARPGTDDSSDGFHGLFDASPIPLIVTTVEDGEVVAVNKATEALSGFNRSQLEGRTVFELGSYADAAERAAHLDAIDTAPAKGREMAITTAAGLRLRLLAHTNRVAFGDQHCLLTALTNITPLTRVDDGRMAAQRMEVIGKLSGGVAHEFNNLLTVMQGHLDALAMEADLPATLRGRVDALGRAVAQATRITSGLLTFSGRNPTAATVIDLNAAIDGLRSLVTGTLGESIEVEWRLTAAPAGTRVAHSHVAQVVLNLALNAREAMPSGGRLVVSTDYLDVAPAGDASGAGPWVRLRVDDSGQGMSEDVRRHALEPFFTTKGPGRGTGLGLSICRGIAEQAGGHIAVHSVPGTGTSVRLYLPWAQAPERSAEVVGRALHRATKVVLLVEDEADVRHIVAEILGRAGHVVHEADGLPGAEALLDTLPVIDLLLTDLVLPGGNGLEVARRVRHRHPDLPVLFMSGYSESVFTGGEAVEHLLQKPFTSRTLLDTVDALFTA